MPRLLNTNEIQLHMPRTGGHSLAKQLGVKELRGTIHDGPGQIPEPWKDYSKVSTFRPPKPWIKSMLNYLHKIGKDGQAYAFQTTLPVDARSGRVDPTFELWEDKNSAFRKFLHRYDFYSWYNAYISYFVAPADRIIHIKKLTKHENRGNYDGS